MTESPGLDDTKYTLTEHLGELRTRLAKSVGAVVLLMVGALAFAPQILEYSTQPLVQVLSNNARVETLLVHNAGETADTLVGQLEEHPKVSFRSLQTELTEVSEIVESAVSAKRPIDLVLVDAEAIGSDGALVSDLLEGVDASPFVAYLVKSAKDPMVQELQLEGAVVILSPPRRAVLSRIVRRAAAAAGKAANGDKLVVLSPLDPFFAYIKIALVVGLFLACPFWLFQGWQFVAPGLYATERKVVLPAVLSASILFISGGLFAYYVMFPMMFDVLVNQMMPASLVGSFTVDKYLGLLLRVTVAFGVVFELPLVMALLAAVGIVDADTLRGFRKYAIVAAFVISAIMTPADPLSQIMMAVPLVVFYEIGILLAGVLAKKRAARLELDPEPEAEA